MIFEFSVRQVALPLAGASKDAHVIALFIIYLFPSLPIRLVFATSLFSSFARGDRDRADPDPETLSLSAYPLLLGVLVSLLLLGDDVSRNAYVVAS